MHDYDVIVLGGGSAGSSAAAAAAAAGARTAMINDGELGGLCILRGCMPSKSMLAAAHAVHDAGAVERFGARLEGRVVPDFAAIMRRKAAHVDRFQRAKIDSVRAARYEVIDARGRFAPGGGVRVGKRTLTARAYVIATGSIPVEPPIPGIAGVPVWTSDDVMRLETRPDRLIVQGAGPLGLELAQFFARVGTEVTLVHRSPLLWRLDADCGVELTRALNDQARLRLLVPGIIEDLAAHESGLLARVRSGKSAHDVRADALVIAVGRRAATDDIGLEHVGLTPVGGVLLHDEQMRTDIPAIYVAGDATGTYQILHLGNAEGRVAGFNAALTARTDPRKSGLPETAPRRMDYRLNMSVIFTDPPFAQIGATSAELELAGRDFIVGRANFPETGRAITLEIAHGLWKILADRRSGEILGSAMLGPRADDLIHIVSTLMLYRGTVEDIFKLPWYHPTLSEVILTVARDLKRQM